MFERHRNDKIRQNLPINNKILQKTTYEIVKTIIRKFTKVNKNRSTFFDKNTFLYDKIRKKLDFFCQIL